MPQNITVWSPTISPPHRCKADGGRIPLAGHALAAIYRAILQIAPQCRGDDLPMRRAVPEGINLHAMVGLDNFDVVTRIQDAGSEIEQAKHHIDPHRHIGRENNRDALCRRRDGCLARRIETRRADDHGHPDRHTAPSGATCLPDG